jgi:hypothetical protein
MRHHAVGLIVPLVLGCLMVPHAVEAQPSAKVPLIGLLNPFSPATGAATVDIFTVDTLLPRCPCL